MFVSRLNISAEIKRRDEDLSRFISGYSTPEKPQSVNEINGDFQLAGLIPAINSYISKYSNITILDVGCGEGTLLAKLVSADIFKNKSDIHYIGVDFPDKIKKAFDTVIDLNCLTQSNFLSLDNTNWVDSLRDNSIIVIRNVFHELKISEAAKLFHDICTYLPKNSVIFIQDMTTLPTSEQGNAGWLGTEFKSILERGGLKVTFTPDTSKRGIDVFLIEATRKNECALSEKKLHDLLLNSRKKQLKLLKEEHDKTEVCPENAIKLHRIYHDIAAISLDLANYEILTNEQTVESVFSLAFDSFSETDIQKLIAEYKYPLIKGFQNRGQYINKLDDFLRSDKSVYILKAGPRLGKKTLVWWALNQKIRHERLPIYLYLNEGTNVCTILEEIASQLKIVDFLDSEILCALKEAPPDILKNSDDIKSSLLPLIRKSILILDGFENCVDPKNKIQNTDVSWLVNFWSDIVEAKIIIQTRYNVEGIPFSKSMMDYMGNFPKGNPEYVYTKQLLDELIPVKYRSENIGFKKYPDDLFVALDNHPYFISIAGTLIRNNPDSKCLLNQNYLAKLEHKLYDVLISEFNLEESEKIAIYSLCLVQVPVPVEFIENLCGEKTTADLLDKGFLVQRMPGRFGLLSILKKMKPKNVDKDETNELEITLHKKISKIFYTMYKDSSEPSFLRQVHRHQLLAGSKKVPAYILPQLSEAAEYWYSNKNYSECIWAYRIIQNQRKLHSRERLKFASCLVRTKNIAEGKNEYNELLKEYKEWKGVKSSYVDSLLFIGKNAQTALKILDKIPEYERDYYWHRQKARCYVQLNNRQDAYIEYEEAILNSKSSKPWNIIREYIAYAHKVGDDDIEYQWLRYAWKDLKLHIDEVRIELGAYYERMDELTEAEPLLTEAYSNSPNNAYCVLPLVKTLCKLGKMKQVNNIMQTSIHAIPQEVMEYANIFILKSNKDFLKAKQLLEKSFSSFTENHNIHHWGQWADLFCSWCQELDGENKIETAEQGLKYVNEIMDEKNVPAMMVCRELAWITGDKNLLAKIEQNILDINDTLILQGNRE